MLLNTGPDFGPSNLKSADFFVYLLHFGNYFGKNKNKSPFYQRSVKKTLDSILDNLSFYQHGLEICNATISYG